MLQSHPQDTLDSPRQTGEIETLCPGVFLLNPDNAGHLIGYSQVARMLKKDLWLFFLLVALSGFSLAVSWQGIAPLWIAIQIQRVGVNVQGKIIGERAAPMGTRGESTAYYLKYQFTNSFGEISTAEQVVSRQIFGRFQMGDAVLVKYLPDDPSLSVLAGGATDAVLDFGNALIVLMGGIGLCAALGLIGYLALRVWQEESYFKHGQLLIGHVLTCHGQMAPFPHSIDVEDPMTAHTGRYMINLAYTFRSPAGETMKATVERQRNDLRGHRLPKFGNPIAVLYLSNKRYRVL